MRRVDRVATIAAPFRGSLEAIAKTAIGIGGFSIASGGSREREAARVTPSLYHLLPTYKGAVTSEGDLSDDIFLAGTWQPGIVQTIATFIKRYGLTPDAADEQSPRLLTAMLDQAWKFRRRMERLELPDSKRWLSIVGVDADTRLGMVVRPDHRGQPLFILEEPSNEWKQGRKTRTGDTTVPYLGARCSFIPAAEIVCLGPGDFGFFEFADKLLNHLGFHSALPSMNLAQRLVTSHLLGRPQGKLGGHPSPEIDPADWDPPIAGLAGK
jgi:hypothetical protein